MCFDFSLALVYAVNDTARKPIVHLIKAQIYQDQNNYSVAIAECDKAIKTAIAAKDKEVEVQARTKRFIAFINYQSIMKG